MMDRASLSTAVSWVYDLILMVLWPCVALFFREIHVRGSWKIPTKGAVIVVAAPHANQFVDSVVLMRILRTRQRRVSWLMAEKSLQGIVGWLASKLGVIPVARAMDNTTSGQGMVYLPNPAEKPLVLRGHGTKFDGPDFSTGTAINLPAVEGRSEKVIVAGVRGPEELVLKKPPSEAALKLLTGSAGSPVGRLPGNASAFTGSGFTVTPHMDQTHVYNAVFDNLDNGGCIGIFPEGGSHDRPALLPLKAGIAIMVLGALAKGTDVKVIPVGLNYFHPHKFRSRAVVEIREPIEISPQVEESYNQGHQREAVGEYLAHIEHALMSVTLSSPDYETMLNIHAARRIYFSTRSNPSLSAVIEVNRRLLKIYTQFQEDSRVKAFSSSIKDYRQQLRVLGIREYQIQYSTLSTFEVLSTLFYRSGLLTVLTIGTLPGLILFAPIFAAARVISHKKTREALAASSVKVQARDVMATWKLLVIMVFTPLMYAAYTCLFVYWTSRNRVEISHYIHWDVTVPQSLALGLVLFPSLCYAALRIGETGMDTLKSIKPFVLCLNPATTGTLSCLRERREELSKEGSRLVNTLGPIAYPEVGVKCILTDARKRATFDSDDGNKKNM